MQGSIEFRQAENLVVTVWQDTRAVVVLSTQHDLSPFTTTVSRKQKDGEQGKCALPTGNSRLQQTYGRSGPGDQYHKYYQE